jgi:hypothetical protein
MQRGARWKIRRPQDRCAEEQEPEWHKRIGDVKDEHEPVSESAVAGPAREPNGLQGASGERQHAGHRVLG